VNQAYREAAAPVQRDRFIPLRKSDLLARLVANGPLDDGQQADLGRFARALAAVFHHRYFDELDRLREAYFHFDPEVSPTAFRSEADLDPAYRALSDEFVRVLTEANFVEIPHDEIIRAFGEHALVRVKIKAPVDDYRDVRMFRRGHRKETVEIPYLFGLRRRSLDVDFYDDVVLIVATRPDGAAAEPRKPLLSMWRRETRTKIRGGAVLFKYFRRIARGDLEALFPNARVVMSLFDRFALGVALSFGHASAGALADLARAASARSAGLVRPAPGRVCRRSQEKPGCGQSETRLD